MPLISIVTPVYNAARWLPETLASVRAQTLTDWEHILVDDCSTDDSVAIVEAAARADSSADSSLHSNTAARIRLLRMERNQGPSMARNLGIDAARGRFIAFLDADDLWLPEKLARSVEWLTAHEYSFVYHDYRHISHDGSLVGALIQAPETLDMRRLHTRRGTGCLTVVIDRELLPDFHFPRNCRYAHEDFCAWLSIVQDGHTGHRLPADLGRYRLSKGSRSANKFRAAVEVWKIYRQASGLSRTRAALWWTEYAWNGFWLHRHAVPRSPRDSGASQPVAGVAAQGSAQL